MDDDAVEAVDLSALLLTTAPGDGPSRARRAGDRLRTRSRMTRVVGSAAIIGLIGVPTINAVRDERADRADHVVVAGGGETAGEDLGERLPPGRPRLFALGADFNAPEGTQGSGIGRRQRGLWIDTETGEQIPVELPAGTTDRNEAEVVTLSRSGGVVLSASSEKAAVPIWFLASDSTRPIRIATGRHIPIPSAFPDRIWLTQTSYAKNGGSYDKATKTAVEIDMAGRTRRTLSLPCCRTLVADSSLGPLASRGDTLEMWDPAARKVVRTFRGVREDITAAATTVRFSEMCNNSARASAFVLSLDTEARRQRRQLGPDCAYTSGLSGALLSPSGRYATAWKPHDGAGVTLVVFDLSRPPDPSIELPRSASSDYPLAWGPNEAVYFADEGFSDSTGGPYPKSVQAFDFDRLESRTLLEGFWATELAVPLPSRVGD